MSNEIKVVLSDVNKIITKVNWLSSNDYTSAEKNKVANIPNDTNADLATKASKLFATNLVTNGDFSNGTTGWIATASTMSVANNELTFLANAVNGRVTQNIQFVQNNKYYLRANVKADSPLVGLNALQLANTTTYHSGSNNFEILSYVFTHIDVNQIGAYRVIDKRTSGWANVSFKTISSINLTSLFGAGNEPTKEQMDWIFTERDRLALGHLNGTQELLPLRSILGLIFKGI